MGDSRQPPGAWLPPAPAVDGAIDRLAFPTAHPSGHPQNTGVCARRGPGEHRRPQGPSPAPVIGLLRVLSWPTGLSCRLEGPILCGMKPSGLWLSSAALSELDSVSRPPFPLTLWTALPWSLTVSPHTPEMPWTGAPGLPLRENFPDCSSL